MREITKYVAFDETEFNNRKDCEDYEGRYFAYMEEAEKIYCFYDAKMKEIEFYINNIEQALSLFYECWEKCAYIRVEGEISIQLDELIYNYLRIDIPEQIGLWEYTSTGWDKVDE